MPAAEPRLITLSISPFNELGRWSLEHVGVEYREEPQGLGLHTFASRRARGKGTTPVLVAGDEVVPEPAEIAEWADRHAPPKRRLFPDGETGEEVRRLVRRFGEELGPASRRVIWKHLIRDIDLACRYWAQGLSRRQARWQRRVMRVARPLAKRSMKLGDRDLEAAPGIVRSYFDEVAERLADGGRIVGDSITASDISFASMASPAVLPSRDIRCGCRNLRTSRTTSRAPSMSFEPTPQGSTRFGFTERNAHSGALLDATRRRDLVGPLERE